MAQAPQITLKMLKGPKNKQFWPNRREEYLITTSKKTKFETPKFEYASRTIKFLSHALYPPKFT